MSVSIQTVEFERREAYLSELEDGPPYTVHGVALGAGDITVGQSGIKKFWPAPALKESAETLEGTNLVVDHENNSAGVVGQVTKAGYKEEVGVIYEAELFDEELAEKISNGLLEVSIRGKHVDVDKMDEMENGAKRVRDIFFENLSIVPTGAAPSNTIEIGSTEELSAAELSAITASLAEIEPGMWVQWDGGKGITISQKQDGEIEVDIYEESDGKWRSTEETKMVSVDSLEEWDVDEEEDIGPAESSEEDSDEEENAISTSDVPQTSRGPSHSSIPGEFFFEAKEDAMDFAETEDGLTGVHEMEGGWVPGDTHDEFIEWWRDERVEMAPKFSEGEMVQWQVNPDMFGKIAHVDSQRDIVMVDVHEMVDGEPQSTGFTISAAFSDLQKMEREEMSAKEELEGFSDYPEAASENAQMALDARDETDNPNDCGTDVGWKRANQLANGESLTREQVGKMAAFNRHRQNSDMDDDEGKADCGWMMWKAWGGDEGVEWAQDKLDEIEEEAAKHHHEKAKEMIPEFLDIEGNSEDTFISAMLEWADNDAVRRAADEYVEEDGDLEDGVGEFEDWLDEQMELGSHSEEEMRQEGEEESGNLKDIREQSPERYPDGKTEELQDYEMHTPDWSGTTEDEWDSPDMEDFDTEDLSEIDDHFLISATGFPPENFGDLALPVVEPNGDLNVNALAAVKGGRGAGAVDGLSTSMEEDIINWVNETANDEFDRDWGDDEENMPSRPPTIDDEQGAPVDTSLDLINKYLRLEGKHERDSVDKMLSWLFGSTDLPMETVSNFRTASNAFLDQTAGTDSFAGLTIEQFRDWLLTHGSGSQGHREQDIDERGELPPGFATPVHVLTGDDLQQRYKSGESELDDVTTKVFNMTEEIEEKLAELNDPVAVEQDDLEELQQKADRFEEMSSTLEELKERTEILDDADREQVEELAEAEEPVVVESARYESLQDEAEQVKTVYAASLSEQMAAFTAEELAERFSIEELREKYEDQIGDPAEELASEPEPRSGDPDEEELEERAEEEQEEEELEPSETDEAEEVRSELKEKILERNK